MNSKSNTMEERKEFIIFLVITYGLAFLMGIPMAVLYYTGKDVSTFVTAQMFYPAAGLMLAKLLTKRGDPLLPKNFFTGFLILTGIMVLWCLAGFLLPGNITSSVDYYLVGAGTIVSCALYFAEEKEKRVAYGLSGKNWKTSILLLLLYVVLLSVFVMVQIFISVGADGLPTVDLFYFYGSIAMLVTLFFGFLGEEYGWRTYFQPLLQRKFGLIRGVLLFGVLWEFWHLPLVFFYYTPLDPSMSLAQTIVMRYISVITVAIFMAYAYMKTNNVWLAVLIHFANNNIMGFTIDSEHGTMITWTTLGILMLIRVAFFLPFLFSKVFKENSLNERNNV